jgi:uncharacterized delta-60 repeat protein
LASSFEPLEQRRLMSGGTIDTTFGQGGNAKTGFFSNDVAVQADGKTITVGFLGMDFAVKRLNVDGTPDATFGNNGLVATDFGGAKGEMAMRVAIQPDGKIVVAGLKIKSGFGSSTKASFALARYNANGSLDGTFGAGGTSVLPGEYKTASMGGLGVQPGTGRIVFSSSVERGGDYDFMVGAVRSDGYLDSSFGSNSAGVTFTGLGGEDNANAQLIQPDGKIVVGGTQYGGIDMGADTQFCLARYTADGKLDKSFSGDGKLHTNMIRTSMLFSLALQPDGKILAGGTMFRAGGHGSDMMLRRFNSDGREDLTLRNGTLMSTPFADSFSSDATSMFVKDDRILVVGAEQNGPIGGGGVRHIFASRYTLDGKLDLSFGSNGFAKFEQANDPSWPRAALAPNEKVVVGYMGPNLANSGAIRFIENPAAQVSMRVSEGQGAEGEAAKNGSAVITLDAPRNSATRVFVSLGGSATLGEDYTTNLSTMRTFGGSIVNVPLVTRGFIGKGGIIGKIGGGILGGGGIIGKIGGGILGGGGIGMVTRHYIDIPAGATSAIVPINVVDNAALESVETATLMLETDPSYVVLPQNSASVSIADNDELHFNFQTTESTTTPITRKKVGVETGIVDSGRVFSEQQAGLSYGWDADNTANARRRNNLGSPDRRYDTFNHMQKNGANRKWEVAVPNGLYLVRLVAGDPNTTDSTHKMNLEGKLALSGKPTGDVRWIRSTNYVQVTDGRLTLSNAAGAVNNKIAFLDIKAAPIGAQPGPVAVNLPVKLYSEATKNDWTVNSHRTFSDKQIDETFWA